jgi:hypothetical protein
MMIVPRTTLTLVIVSATVRKINPLGIVFGFPSGKSLLILPR